MSKQDEQGPLDFITEPIRKTIQGPVDDTWEKAKSDIGDFFISLDEQIRTGVSSLMEDLVDLILTTPTVSDQPIVHQIWSDIQIISFCIIGGLFVWKGLELVLSNGSIGRNVDIKDMFVRMIYGIILAVASLAIVDIMIYLNNAFVEGFRARFPMVIDSKIYRDNTFTYILSMALIVVQIVLSVRIAIQYFMRLGEIWLMTVLGPLFYTLWINPSMGGYLSTWLRRLFTTIFTQFIWAVILALYTGFVSMVALDGTVWSMCMSLALLLTMLKTPNYLHQFMHSTENPFQIMNQAKSRTLRNMRKVKNFKSGISKKVTGFINK